LTAFLGYEHSPKWHIYGYSQNKLFISRKPNGRRSYSTFNKNNTVITRFLNDKSLKPVIVFENLHIEETTN
jgi:hypothetical protein